MSWLSNVNNLLTKLDDQVETVVEERAFAVDNDEIFDDEVETGIDDILLKRGLIEDDDDAEDEHNKRKESKGKSEKEEEPNDDSSENERNIEQKKVNIVSTAENENNEEIAREKKPPAKPELDLSKNTNGPESAGLKIRTKPISGPTSISQSSDITRKNADGLTEGAPPLSRDNKPTDYNSVTISTPNRCKKEHREWKEAQKEARTLRRHVVSLNEQLEAAELELQAQRKELERAAERIEKDRVRQKQEKETYQKHQLQETTLLLNQHKAILKEQQARYEDQVQQYRTKLNEEEKRRKQEDGSRDKEISHAVDREQEMRITFSKLEDEKLILLQQISTLQGQQTALGLRLESLTQGSENAMEREREAEDRLDVALSQHCLQIRQRQARESQLERTIQDLNTALVVSRGNARPPAVQSTSGSTSSLEARFNALEMDLQTANAALVMKREQSQTLQDQLKETTQEANVTHAKQIQYDRLISDMRDTISNLESKLRKNERLSLTDTNRTTATANDNGTQNQIRLISDEVLRLRDKIANQNSESLAMKNRLNVAIERSNKLEDELEVARTESNCNKNVTYNPTSGERRRRYGTPTSMRNAILLNSSNTDRTEQIGQVVDQIDTFAVSTGKYLKRNPLARAGFILYLIMIHFWSFVLLFYHAHSLDHQVIPSDFSQPHSPHAMLKQNIGSIIDHAVTSEEQKQQNEHGNMLTDKVAV